MNKKIKTVSYITGFLVIALLFTSITFGERIKFGELPLKLQAGIMKILGQNPPQEGETPQTYELLIKKVKTGSGNGAYKAGDIVAAEPEGRKWSPAERQNFWIVKMTLTPSQAKKLVESKEIQTGTNEDGEPQMETQARRKYYIPAEKLEGKDKKVQMDRNAVKER